MSQPLVSVAMIAYNHRPFIRQALESVLSQACDFEFEIVISDDRSPDGTGEIIDEFQAKHAKIRRLDPPANVGMHENFDRVWRACRGKYVAWLEGDDWWTDPDKLRVQAAFLEAHPEATIVGGKALITDVDGTVESEFPRDAEQIPELTDADRLLWQGNYLQTGSVMLRRGVIDGVPAWIRKLGCVDYPFFLLHAFRGSVGFQNRTFSAYRRHAGGVWTGAEDLRRNVSLATTYWELAKLSDEETGGRRAALQAAAAGHAVNLRDFAYEHRCAGDFAMAWKYHRALMKLRWCRADFVWLARGLLAHGARRLRRTPAVPR